MGEIFGDRRRTGLVKPLFGHTTLFSLDHRDGPDWDAMRELVESWWIRSPKESQLDLKGRLLSGDDEQFRGAFVELYVSELLLRAGCQLIGHPELGESSTRPDYLAVDGQGKEFVVEVTTTAPPKSSRAEKNRLNSLLDSINQISIQKYFLGLSVESIGPNDVSKQRLRRELQAWIETLDLDKVAEHLESYRNSPDLAEPYSFNWQSEGWNIDFRAYPKRPEFYDVPSSAIGVHGPSHASVVNDVESMRSRLKDKSNKYGNFDKPYVIALATSEWVDPTQSTISSLYGDDQITITLSPDGNDTHQNTRAPNGFFLNQNGLSNPHVSAVLILNNISPWGFSSCIPQLWHHPDPKNAIETFSPVLTSFSVGSDGILARTEPDISQNAYFGIPTSWPKSSVVIR